MKKSDLSNKDKQERAQGLREKLRNLKLQSSPPKKDCSNYYSSNNGFRPLINISPPPPIPIEPQQNFPIINNNTLSYQPPTTSPPKIVNETFENLSELNDNNCGVSSIDESISKCHHNIMRKFFSSYPTSSDNNTPSNSGTNTLLRQQNDPIYCSKKSGVNSTTDDDSKNPINILQSNHKLKYKFNTKYELDYGNNVLRARNTCEKPVKLYNPSMLRSIHRKLSETNSSTTTNSKLLDSLKIIPVLKEDKIVCLLENGIQNRPTFPFVDFNTSPPIDDDTNLIMVTIPGENNTKSIVKKAAKNITFSIDVQYYDAIINGELETIKQIAPLMDDFAKKTARGKTPLHLAVESREMCVVDYFIEKGLDVNAQDIRGQTPLHIASYNNNINMIQFLLENGASPYIFSDFLDGFPSMVINEYLSNAYDCIAVFEEYNHKLGIVNNGIVYPICDWAGDLAGDLPLKEMSAIVITERNDMLLAKKWKAVDKRAKRGLIPWQIIALHPTRNYQNKYHKHHNANNEKKDTLQTLNTYNNQNINNHDNTTHNE